MRKFFLGAVAAAALALPSIGHAQDLGGDTITCQVASSGTLVCDRGTATVGGGREFTIETDTGGSNVFGVNFTPGGELVVNALSTFAIGGDVFLQFFNTTDPFTGVALLENSGFVGFTSGDAVVRASDGRLRLNVGGTSGTQGAQLRLALSTGSAVPEPATWAFMLIGFGAVGYSLRRAPQRRALALV